jgi:hypothetical protein
MTEHQYTVLLMAIFASSENPLGSLFGFALVYWAAKTVGWL